MSGRNHYQSSRNLQSSDFQQSVIRQNLSNPKIQGEENILSSQHQIDESYIGNSSLNSKRTSFDKSANKFGP